MDVRTSLLTGHEAGCLGWICSLAWALLELVLVIQDLVLLVLSTCIGYLLGQLGVIRIVKLEILICSKDVCRSALA